MVDISIQILSTMVHVPRDNLKFKIKTWWTHVDVGDITNCNSSISIPQLPMIQYYYNITGRETTIFIEVWSGDKGTDKRKGFSETGTFLGMAKCCVDQQLKIPNLNPSVEWLEIYDPIEDIDRGRLLLRINAKFAESNASSGLQTVDQEGILDKTYVSSCKMSDLYSTNPSICSKSPSFFSPEKRNVPVQTDHYSNSPPVALSTCSGNEKADRGNSLTNNSKEKPFQQTKSSVNKSSPEKFKYLKKSTGSKDTKAPPFEFTVAGKKYTIELDGTAHQMKKYHSSPKTKIGGSLSSNGTENVNASTPLKQFSTSRKQNSSLSNGIVDFSKVEPDVEDVIDLLNDDSGLAMSVRDHDEGTGEKTCPFPNKSRRNVPERNRANLSTSTNNNNCETQINAYSDYNYESNQSVQISPNGRNETESNDDMSYYNYFDETTIIKTTLFQTNEPELAKSLSFDGDNQKSPAVQNLPLSKVTQNPKETSRRPPRSRRIAAAIYDDYYD